jgi:hypothetical protein
MRKAVALLQHQGIHPAQAYLLQRRFRHGMHEVPKGCSLLHAAPFAAYGTNACMQDTALFRGSRIMHKRTISKSYSVSRHLCSAQGCA